MTLENRCSGVCVFPETCLFLFTSVLLLPLLLQSLFLLLPLPALVLLVLRMFCFCCWSLFDHVWWKELLCSVSCVSPPEGLRRKGSFQCSRLLVSQGRIYGRKEPCTRSLASKEPLYLSHPYLSSLLSPSKQVSKA